MFHSVLQLSEIFFWGLSLMTLSQCERWMSVVFLHMNYTKVEPVSGGDCLMNALTRNVLTPTENERKIVQTRQSQSLNENIEMTIFLRKNPRVSILWKRGKMSNWIIYVLMCKAPSLSTCCWQLVWMCEWGEDDTHLPASVTHQNKQKKKTRKPRV